MSEIPDGCQCSDCSMDSDHKIENQKLKVEVERLVKLVFALENDLNDVVLDRVQALRRGETGSETSYCAASAALDSADEENQVYELREVRAALTVFSGNNPKQSDYCRS